MSTPLHPTGDAPDPLDATDESDGPSLSVGGVLLLVGAVLGFAWANSPWSGAYEALSAFRLGPASLHLDLTMQTWAADGLLAVFFFVVGVELKRELVVGSLRHLPTAALPALTAVAGMVVPAALYVATVAVAGGGDLRGWAVPTATDIAFALAVLALVGRGLPSGARLFLLTLAVVDDLLAITVIAVFYTADLRLGWLAAAAVVIAAFAAVVRLRGETRVRRVLLVVVLIVLAVLAWVLVHASGVHATIAGVTLGLVIPARPRAADGGTAPEHGSRAERAEHAVRPWSDTVALPVFAFFAAGVSLASTGGFAAVVGSPEAWGVAVGLVIGKPLGVMAAVLLLGRFTRLQLPTGMRAADAVPVAFLTGIGFTVSLLVSELAFGAGKTHDEVTLAVFVGSLLSAAAAAAVLAARRRTPSGTLPRGGSAAHPV